jgi:cytochrome c oxidase assembly factor CtaG
MTITHEHTVAQNSSNNRIVLGSLASMLILLTGPMDSLADQNLTVHMFQHIGLFVSAIFFGYGMDRILVSRLLWLKQNVHVGWRAFVGLMRFNSRTRGLVFAGILPSIAIFYWHIPSNFDLAVTNGYVHILEHLTYIIVGTFVGASAHAIPRRFKAGLVFFGFMIAGMMGSMMVVWPYFYDVYSAAQNTQMDTAMMLFGAVGIIGTSTWLLKVLDVF